MSDWSDDEKLWAAMEPALCAPARLALADGDVTAILKSLDLPPRATVLDLGCGPGAHAIAIGARGYRVTRVDRSRQLLERARSKSGMLELLVRIGIVAGAVVVWFAGLRLFLQSDLSSTRKAGWTAFLVLAGIGIGVVLPLRQVWSKFILLVVILPVLGLADVWLLRSRRGLSFWIRACGFEVCTVFSAAAAARFLLDLAGAAAFVPTGN